MKPQLIAVPVAVALMLLAAVLGALRLLSYQGLLSPTLLTSFRLHHGELMVFGFLAPLILTERYLGATGFSLNRSIHAIPFLAAAGALLKLLAWVTGVGALNTLGSVGIAVAVVFYLYILYGVGKQSSQFLPFLYMMLGALVLLIGALLNISRSPAGNLPFTLFLLSFPVLTILGERVELTRFLSPAAHGTARYGLGVALAASALLLLRLLVWDSTLLVAIWAVLLAATAAPLLGPELNLVRAGQRGLYRYLGRHLVLAYFWLFLSLIILVIAKETYPLSDATTHALATGFVLTMIMAHAPVIAPVIVPRRVAAERLNYYPLALLTAGTAMRVVGQALEAGGFSIPALAGISGVVVLVAIITFMAMLLRSLRPATDKEAR